MEQSQNIAKLLEDLKKASGLSLQLADTEDGIPENAEEKLALLTAAWREKYDRNSFLRNLLCGTYSGADLYTAAARFHIPEHRRRVLFVIELKMPCAFFARCLFFGPETSFLFSTRSASSS